MCSLPIAIKPLRLKARSQKVPFRRKEPAVAPPGRTRLKALLKRKGPGAPLRLRIAPALAPVRYDEYPDVAAQNAPEQAALTPAEKERAPGTPTAQEAVGEQGILDVFRARRRVFNAYLRDARIPLSTCPGCGFPTLEDRAGFEICIVCNWEDDGQDDADADEVRGGPNGALSLTGHRVRVGRMLDRSGRRVSAASVLEFLNSITDTVIAMYAVIPHHADRSHPSWLKAVAWQERVAARLPELPVYRRKR